MVSALGDARHAPGRHHSGPLHHGDHSACSVEATSDLCLPDLYAALPCILYAHLDWGGNGAAALPAYRTCACRPHAHGAKRRRSGYDCVPAGADHDSWRTRYRSR